MLLFLFPLLVALAFFIEVCVVRWFFWALYDVGYVSHTLDWSQGATVALPLFVATIIGVFSSSSS